MFDRFFDHARARPSARAGLALVLAVSVTAATACGSDNDDRPAGQQAPANDKARIRQLIKDLQAEFLAGEADSYCSKFTATGRGEIAAVAKQFGHGSTCEDFVTVTSKMTRDSDVEQKPTATLAVRVDGNRAVATVSDGGRAAVPMTFVKQGGEWKRPTSSLKSLLSGEPSTPPKSSRPQPLPKKL
jgi:hypothetical protein